MDVKYTEEAAHSLLNQMDKYCMDVSKNAGELLGIFENMDNWNDGQKNIMREDILMLCQNLNEILIRQSDYMRIFMKKINELEK